MELGGTSGNVENVVILNTMTEEEILDANKIINDIEYRESTIIYYDEGTNDLIKVVDYRNHIALLVRLNKIKRAQLEINDKKVDIKSSPILENNKDYVIQMKRDGNDWKENMCIDGLLTVRTGRRKHLGLVEETHKVQVSKIQNSPVFILNID